MHALLKKLAPSATDMIRADHTRVMAKFHRYKIDAAPHAKQALAELMCDALEVHAQIEDEIFYPAARAAGLALVDELAHEHGEMRRLIGALRSLDPASSQFDQTFMELMRTVIHHVADEETAVLPGAERRLADRLGELGARMTKRRLQLAAPRMGEMARESVRAMPRGSLVLGAGALLAGAYVVRQGLRRHQ
jgi:hypothetical protein